MKQTSLVEALIFPETDELPNIISDTIKVVFKRRLVDRVLRLCTEMARKAHSVVPGSSIYRGGGRNLKRGWVSSFRVL